jgi:hypothetical protein
MRFEQYIGTEWFVCGMPNDFVFPENQRGVYLLTIVSPLLSERVLCYIGATERISGRIYTHQKISHLRGLEGIFSVEVLFLQIEGNVYEHELRLIKSYNPPLNLNCPYKKPYTEDDLRDDLKRTLLGKIVKVYEANPIQVHEKIKLEGYGKSKKESFLKRKSVGLRASTQNLAEIERYFKPMVQKMDFKLNIEKSKNQTSK